MITIKANGRCAKAASDEPITTGSVGIPVVFQLNADFDGLSAIAEFRGNEKTVDVALVSDRCVVPPEVLQEPGGRLWIGVYGRNGEGTVVIPTVWDDAGIIQPGVAPSGVDPAEPTPNWTAQVQAAAAEALQTANTANENSRAAVERSNEALQTARETLETAETALGKADTSMLAAKGYAEAAEASSEEAAHYAELAEQGADKAGYAWFDINDEDGGLYVTVTPDLAESVRFAIDEEIGLLEVIFHG